ncbi:MAG: nodulation protein NfeD [Actinobacteria bacterium]|nr:nodulation protein NfeD [Actinomycetota bacterium]
MIGEPKKAILLALVFFIFAGLTFSLGASGNISGISSGTGDQPHAVSSGTETAIEIDSFYSCRIDGIIEPSLANHIKKCLALTKDSGYGLIINMDTPGGLDASMREIITAMLNTPVPVIVYVSPEGARAASAGVFITYAGDIAAMVPSTNIGAAHPVNIGSDQEISADIMEKVLNDSVAYIKNLAISRNRNAEWAEQAVRESVSITSEEALELGVIDLIAEDTSALLIKLDGRIIEKLGDTYILRSADTIPVEISMNFMTRFLHIISDPNIAYILLSLGILGIIYEFSQPGLGISGAIGVLMLILGLYALSVLPINYAGLGLIILALILFILDILMGLGGIPSISGVVSLIIGSFLLINTDAPYLRIAWSLIISVSVVVSGFLIIVVRAVYRAHRVQPFTGMEGIIGETAISLIGLAPYGQVKMSGEIWGAVSVDGKMIKKGKKVRIESIEGLTLKVTEISNNNKEGG